MNQISGGATFSLLPEKDELILFGGDYFDNNKVSYQFSCINLRNN